MSQEIIYTSSPQGLRPGSFGFCTVATTPGMASSLAERLEALSGYRHAHPSGDPRAAFNPVVFSHSILKVGGQKLHVLSRIADAGLDYSQRTNKLAHHVALNTNELPPAGPAWVLSQPGFAETLWTGTPRILPAGRKPPSGNLAVSVCKAWEQATGDAGWAGVLAQQALDSKRPAYIIFPEGFDVLTLLVEAQALLPPPRRWEVSFSTYFTRLPAGVDCSWRCVLAGSPEANAAAALRGEIVLDLTRPLGPALDGQLVELARTGRLPTHVSASNPPPDLSQMLVVDDSEVHPTIEPPQYVPSDDTLRPAPPPLPRPPRRGEQPATTRGFDNRDRNSPSALAGRGARWAAAIAGLVLITFGVGIATHLVRRIATQKPIAAVDNQELNESNDQGAQITNEKERSNSGSSPEHGHESGSKYDPRTDVKPDPLPSDAAAPSNLQVGPSADSTLGKEEPKKETTSAADNKGSLQDSSNTPPTPPKEQTEIVASSNRKNESASSSTGNESSKLSESGEAGNGAKNRPLADQNRLKVNLLERIPREMTEKPIRLFELEGDVNPSELDVRLAGEQGDDFLLRIEWKEEKSAWQVVRRSNDKPEEIGIGIADIRHELSDGKSILVFKWLFNGNVSLESKNLLLSSLLAIRRKNQLNNEFELLRICDPLSIKSVSMPHLRFNQPINANGQNPFKGIWDADVVIDQVRLDFNPPSSSKWKSVLLSSKLVSCADNQNVRLTVEYKLDSSNKGVTVSGEFEFVNGEKVVKMSGDVSPAKYGNAIWRNQVEDLEIKINEVEAKIKEAALQNDLQILTTLHNEKHSLEADINKLTKGKWNDRDKNKNKRKSSDGNPLLDRNYRDALIRLYEYLNIDDVKGKSKGQINLSLNVIRTVTAPNGQRHPVIVAKIGDPAIPTEN